MNKFFVYNNNDLVTKTYTISNNGSKQTNVKVIFTLPSGIAISRVTPSKGSYSNKIWSIGELVENEIVNIVVIYTVTNINLAPYKIEAQVESTEGGLFCENYIYVEKSLTPCTDCNKAYPIFPAFSATNGSYTARTLDFLDNNISFSTTVNGTLSQIFAYYKPGEIHAGTNYIELGNVKLENSNGVTFGLNGSILTASHNGLLTQHPQAISASNSSLTFHTLQFGNTLGLSHYISNGSVLISSNPINNLSVLGNTTAQSSSNTYNNLVISANGIISAGISGNTLVLSATAPSGTSLQFSNANGITFGTVGSTLTASHNGLTSQSNQVVSANNGSITFQTLSLGNLNGFSFYTTNGSIAGSYTVPSGAIYSVQAPGSTYTNSVQFNNANGVSFIGGVGGISASIATQIVTNVSNSNNVSLGIAAGLLTASVSQTNQTLGLYALGNTTNNTSTTLDARSLSIVGFGDISIGYSNNSVQISNTPQYDTVFPRKQDYVYTMSTLESTVQYGFTERLDHNLVFNNLYIPIYFTATKSVGTASTNLSWTGNVNLNIYTNVGSTLSLLSEGYYAYDFSCSTRVPGSFGSQSFYYAYNYSQKLGSYSTTGSSTYSTGITSSNGSHNITNIIASLLGSAQIPIVKASVDLYLQKGLYYFLFSIDRNSTNLGINSIGVKSVDSKSYLDLMEYNANNFPLQKNFIIAPTITNNTSSSYNTTAVSTNSNVSYIQPSLIFIKT